MTINPKEYKVALLAGGTSGEREISIKSGEGARGALETAGFDITWIDPANKEDLKRLIDEFGLTHDAAARAVGRSRSAVTNLLRLTQLAKPVQEYLQKQIPPGGPSDEERAKGKTYLWGVARDLNGNRVESRMQTPEGYTITALAALNIAQKILDGNFKRGFQTPAKAYGADLVMEIEGVSRHDVS